MNRLRWTAPPHPVRRRPKPGRTLERLAWGVALAALGFVLGWAVRDAREAKPKPPRWLGPEWQQLEVTNADP